MKNQTWSGGVMVAVVVAWTGLSMAAGPFTVRRADCGASVDGSPVVATVLTAPFDETVSRSSDAESYFYGVYDASGARLSISVQSFGPSGPIRIGFDDANPHSALVAATLSSVAAAPASIRADGVQQTIVTITPRDPDGRLLGRGLSISIDPSFLWPLALDGPVQDLGDGTYRASATSTTPGTGSVRVTVEGVVLTASPDVEATSPDASSLRDLAILRLRDLTTEAGRFGAADGPMDAARDHALVALAILSEDDPARDDNAIKTSLDAALLALGALEDPDGSVADLAHDLLDVARLIALWHLEDAVSACGVCSDWATPRKMCDAQAAFDDAEITPRTGGAGWSAAADRYARSVELALQARQACTH